MENYLLACSVMYVFAIVANLSDRRMLLLTIVVGVGFYWPPPEQSYLAFYTFCIAMELFVGLMAFQIHRKAGIVILDIALLLVFCHLMAIYLDGSKSFSPYRLLVKLLEFSQISACVALSPVIAPILRNRDEASV